MAPKYFPRADTLFALGTVLVLNTSAMVACYVGLKPYVEDPTQIWWPESSVVAIRNTPPLFHAAFVTVGPGRRVDVCDHDRHVGRGCADDELARGAV